jgi:hypothetical protein
VRISESRLKQIIRQEARLILREGAFDPEELRDRARRLANVGDFFDRTSFEIGHHDAHKVEKKARDYVTQAAAEMGVDPAQHRAEIDAAAGALRDEYMENAMSVTDDDGHGDEEHLHDRAWGYGFFDQPEAGLELAQQIVDDFIEDFGTDRIFDDEYRNALVDHLMRLHGR